MWRREKDGVGVVVWEKREKREKVGAVVWEKREKREKREKGMKSVWRGAESAAQRVHRVHKIKVKEIPCARGAESAENLLLGVQYGEARNFGGALR